MQVNSIPKIAIITGPVGIGKSSLLNRYVQHFQGSLHGFVCLVDPETNLRKLQLYPSLEHLDFQTTESDSSTQSIGRFHFKKRAFQQALQSLRASDIPADLCIVDELGKLEIEMDLGFEPAFTAFLSQLKAAQLLLIIRSSLLDKAIQKYGWTKYSLNQGPWMPRIPPIKGVVLAGGNSSRMQKDKKQIAYHGMPQWKYAFQQLSALGLETCISSNDMEDGDYTVIADHPQFSNAGPMSGLLSVSQESADTALLVLGVDYPNMDSQTLKDLIYAFQIRNCSVCYRNPESQTIEPLIALYHPLDLLQLRDQFGQTSNSLRLFWEASQERVLVLPHRNPEVLKSYDFPADEAAFRTR